MNTSTAKRQIPDLYISAVQRDAGSWYNNQTRCRQNRCRSKEKALDALSNRTDKIKPADKVRVKFP